MAASLPSKTGHLLAKVLGIKLDDQRQNEQAVVTRGESIVSVSTTDTFVEEEPTAVEWVRETLPSGHELVQYARSLFPFTNWILRYNLQWLFGDLVAGITVGCVVVPQGMAYAGLAELKPEFGLYSSFMGVLIYWFFATSKDITIGPVAVMSTIVGNVVLNVKKTNPDLAPDEVASALAIIAGAIIVFIGLVRCGWIVDFISLASISAFMTGSALNIAVGQVPTMMGISGFSTRASTYLVVINTLKHLGRSNLNAAMGLTALAMLYIIRSACKYAARKYPKHEKLIFFISTLRTAFVILLYTLISWLVNRHRRSHHAFKILGKVPRGFKHARVPTVNKTVIKAFASQLPATVIVLLIEHIAISKSFGRVNNYTIDPSQELVAIGVTNLLGPFLGGYPATGSFSRTAIKSKAGVRTPFAGVITAIVVLLAIYALPAVFYYIPNATLAGVIIHAVGDLITPPNTVYQFWRVSPLEVLIFFAGVIITVFSSIENGIYTTICVSAALLLFRVVKARGRFLGRVKIHSVVGDHVLEDDKDDAREPLKGNNDASVRNIFLPIDHQDGSNPQIDVERPYPGIYIYRFSEGFNYPNANHYLDKLVATIFKETQRTDPFTYGRPGDRPWNDPGPRRGKEVQVDDHRPTLKAIVLDFSSVNNVDITSVQQLIDVRNQLDRYAAPDRVDWHFACINNRWTKRALASAGFGYPTPSDSQFHRWKPVFSVAEIGGQDSAAAVAEKDENIKELQRLRTQDAESARSQSAHKDEIHIQSQSSLEGKDSAGYGTALKVPHPKVAVVHGINRPLFHIDLTSALQSAIANAEAKSLQANNLELKPIA
ncbi:sulfate permease [Xylona heveae TC161]|uniref:Sulfate permease n=1 Tax=Xylona heveae (strain CBS 132557 / TC161) TaxID=1328760 RepID=A0A165J8K8_XYLHT|nr:sulfate permease [Xylona heveae TC161]KZF25896.1 sulfate permease [Xylona heveae TC161]